MATHNRKRPLSRCSGRWTVAVLLPLTCSANERSSTWTGRQYVVPPSSFFARGGEQRSDGPNGGNENSIRSQPAERNRDIHTRETYVEDEVQIEFEVEGNASSLLPESDVLGDFELKVHASLTVDDELQGTLQRLRRRILESKKSQRSISFAVSQPPKPLNQPYKNQRVVPVSGQKPIVDQQHHDASFSSASRSIKSDSKDTLDAKKSRQSTAITDDKSKALREKQVELELAEKRRLLMDLLSSYQNPKEEEPHKANTGEDAKKLPKIPARTTMNRSVKDDQSDWRHIKSSHRQVGASGGTFPPQRRRPKHAKVLDQDLNVTTLQSTAQGKGSLQDGGVAVERKLSESMDEMAEVVQEVQPAKISHQKRKRKVLLMASSAEGTRSQVHQRIWNSDLKGGETIPPVVLMQPSPTLLSPADMRAIQPHLRMLTIGLLYVVAASIALRLVTWALGFNR